MTEDFNNEPVKDLAPKHRTTAVVGIFCTISMISLILFSRPESGGPIAILIFLFLAFVLLFTFTITFIRLLKRVMPAIRISAYKSFYMAFVVALGVIFLIGLQTLQQLRLIDVALVILFEVLINFYIIRRF